MQPFPGDPGCEGIPGVKVRRAPAGDAERGVAGATAGGRPDRRPAAGGPARVYFPLRH